MQEFIRECFIIWILSVVCILVCCYLLLVLFNEESNKKENTEKENPKDQLKSDRFENLTDKEKLDWHNYDGICTGLQRWCPRCLSNLEYGELYAACYKGHKYLIIQDEIDLKKIRKEIWDKNRVGKLRKNF